MTYHALFVSFEKSGKIQKCHVLQLIGGALRVKSHEGTLSTTCRLYGSPFHTIKCARRRLIMLNVLLNKNI